MSKTFAASRPVSEPAAAPAEPSALEDRILDESLALLGAGFLAASVADQADEESNLLAALLGRDLSALNDELKAKRVRSGAELAPFLGILRADVVRVEAEGGRLPQTAALAALLRPVLDRLALALELAA